MFRGAISPTLTGTTLSAELRFQRNGVKTLANRSRLTLIDLNENLRPHVEETTTMQAPVNVFTKVTCMCNLHIIITLLQWRAKNLENHQCVWIIHDMLFLSSCCEVMWYACSLAGELPRSLHCTYEWGPSLIQDSALTLRRSSVYVAKDNSYY